MHSFFYEKQKLFALADVDTNGRRDQVIPLYRILVYTYPNYILLHILYMLCFYLFVETPSKKNRKEMIKNINEITFCGRAFPSS
jgi:hypothetical protein